MIDWNAEDLHDCRLTSSRAKVVLGNCKFYCHHCCRWLPGSCFGLRIMHRSDPLEIRNQPQCKKCRNRYEARKRKAKRN